MPTIHYTRLRVPARLDTIKTRTYQNKCTHTSRPIGIENFKAAPNLRAPTWFSSRSRLGVFGPWCQLVNQPTLPTASTKTEQNPLQAGGKRVLLRLRPCSLQAKSNQPTPQWVSTFVSEDGESSCDGSTAGCGSTAGAWKLDFMRTRPGRAVNGSSLYCDGDADNKDSHAGGHPHLTKKNKYQPFHMRHN